MFFSKLQCFPIKVKGKAFKLFYLFWRPPGLAALQNNNKGVDVSELAEDADHLGHDPGVGLRTLGLVIRAEAGRVHHHHRPPGVPAPRPLPAIIIIIIIITIIIIVAISEVMTLHNDSNSIQLVK